MPQRPAAVRAKDFTEVPTGYTREMAQIESSRCIQCKKPLCVPSCPAEIDIPGFIKAIKDGDTPGAVRVLKKSNSLPAVCGRVCPQEVQCEMTCVIGRKGKPVSIGALERYAADTELAKGAAEKIEKALPTGKKVAVIGAGPAGLTVAADLARLGHAVTLFEALHAPGGVLVYGIPEFRLPKAIVQQECDYVAGLGVEVRLNTPVGQSVTGPGLLKAGYDAVFIGTGAGLPSFLGIPGENLKGVYSSNEFLTRVNLMKAYRFPEYGTPVLRGRNAVVVGGGNVAMDSARCALRLGEGRVTLVYRRTRKEMPARAEEIEHAIEEGVDVRELTAPLKVLGDENGWVKGMECLKMELGEPDASGRRRPVPLKGSEHVIEADQLVVAIGQGPNPLLTRNWPELKRDKHGLILVDENLTASVPGVFAGGDIVSGAATVILAIGNGKKAARSIDAWLKAGNRPAD